MINYVKKNINKHTLNWSRIPDHPYRKLTVGGPWSGKISILVNLTKQEDKYDYNIVDEI